MFTTIECNKCTHIESNRACKESKALLYSSVVIDDDWIRQIENQKLDIKAQSKVGSLDNVKHRPGGGDVKIFDDKDYLKQVAAIDHVASPSEVRWRLFGFFYELVFISMIVFVFVNFSLLFRSVSLSNTKFNKFIVKSLITAHFL